MYFWCTVHNFILRASQHLPFPASSPSHDWLIEIYDVVVVITTRVIFICRDPIIDVGVMGHLCSHLWINGQVWVEGEVSDQLSFREYDQI